MSRPRGFTPATTRVIKARSGLLCEVQVDPDQLAHMFPHVGPTVHARWRRRPRCRGEAIHKHHRRNRAAGSTKRAETNEASAALHACLTCHDFIGAEPSLSLKVGWLVDQTDCPSSRPVLYRGTFVTLDNCGGFERVPAPTQEAG